jgi:peptidoglycan/xylan/chitin deacetylase (PgdA/CDA1 family)
MRFIHRHHLTIVLYHGVAPHTHGSNGIFNYRKKFITPQAFEAQVAFFASRYTILQLDEAVQRLQEGTLPRYSLVITFDDGYANFYEYAYPILKKYAAPATVFLATNFVFNQEPLWVDRLEYAIGMGGNTSETPEQKKALDLHLREEMKHMPNETRLVRLLQLEENRHASLSMSGYSLYSPLTKEMLLTMQGSAITYGAHTKSHPILTQISAAEARSEIMQSKDIIKRECGNVSNIFAYPNGQESDFNAGIVQTVQEAQYHAALTTLPGTNTNTTPLFALYRYTLDGTDDFSTFVVVLSGLREMWKKYRP